MALDLSSDDEEIGEFIYRTSRTARLLRAEKEQKVDEDKKKASTQDNAKNMVKVEVKAEGDISTDDEQYSPEYVVSPAQYYDPVKYEETDSEDTGDDNTVQHLPIEEESVETDNVRVRRRKSPRLLANPTTQFNASMSIQDNMGIQHTTKKRKRHCSKRKRKVEGEESDKSVQKVVRIECSIEGCTYKAADSGTCKAKHRGWNYCSQEGCTNIAQKGGVCIKHGASWTKKTCKHEGCTNIAQKGGVCVKHGAKVTCSHKGCANQIQNRGVCFKHGAKKKTCSHDGCTKLSRKGGVCYSHREFAIGKKVR